MDLNNTLKYIKNPLLQSAQQNTDLISTQNQPLLVPFRNDSSLSSAGELDNFIGQENSPSLLTKSSSGYSDQSVPLIVPSNEEETSSSSQYSPLPRQSSSAGSTTGSSASIYPSTCSNREATVQIGFSHNAAKLENNSKTFNANNSGATSPHFFDPSYFQDNSNRTSTSADNSLSERLSSFNLNGGNPARPPTGPANNNYRLGNLKRPAYAHIPNFQSSSSNLVASAQHSIFSNNNLNPINSFQSFATAESDDIFSSSTPTTSPPVMYHPPYHHWFYRLDLESNWFYQKEADLKSIWKPFSMNDSLALESAFSLPSLDDDTVVATDGGRYDVLVTKRERTSVYWEEPPSLVRRCSWFYRGSCDNSYIPYTEALASKLEEKYKLGMTTNSWPQVVDVGDNEEVVMRNGSSIIHQVKSLHPYEDISPEPTQSLHVKPCVVKRGGFDEFDISDGESETVDHLLFLVHGIGQFCDLKCRSITEVVDEFRNLSVQLSQSHFPDACETGAVNRIEILPVSWHQALHGDETGIDTRLKNITLPSIPRLRDFANDTILDVLFYNSPVFCQVIINTVTFEINKLHALFLKRNPNFNGKISVGGHSLGSLILFDILTHQSSSYKPSLRKTEEVEEDDTIDEDKEMPTSSKMIGRKRPKLTRKVSYVTVGHAGTGQPYVKYSHLHFSPRFFFAFGSPIAAFVATRSSEILGQDFKFPTCSRFFNIFHPYDPIAYRIEPLIIPSLSDIKPVQIQHHKGRKRMHLELRETVSNVGQKLYDTVKNTWNMMYLFSAKDSENDVRSIFDKIPTNPKLIPHEPTAEGTNIKVGKLNDGNRIDYVLQEAPVEYINEYLFALASHLCYWTSRDTMLMVLKEIYSDVGILSQSSPVDANSSQRSSPSLSRNYLIDPTEPITENIQLGPPPTSGFVRK